MTEQLEAHGLYVVFIAAVLLLVAVMAVYAAWEAWTDHRDQHQHEPRGDSGPSSAGGSQVPAFVCPDCGARSWHPEDGRWGYCGRCHAFTGRPAGLDLPTDPGRAA